jgi:hypothetical protein
MTIIATTVDNVFNWRENFPIETNLFPNIIFSPVTAALAAKQGRSICRLSARVRCSALNLRLTSRSPPRFGRINPRHPAICEVYQDRSAKTAVRPSCGVLAGSKVGATLPAGDWGRICIPQPAVRNTHVPVGAWRGVNTNQNAVYMECFIDEVAKAAGRDPLEFRRSIMGAFPKHRAVLDAVAEKAEWGKPLPAGIHRGIAQFNGYGTYSAAVAEVSVSDTGKLKVHRYRAGGELRPSGQSRPDRRFADFAHRPAGAVAGDDGGECGVPPGRLGCFRAHFGRALSRSRAHTFS